jgi:hypothetical protein
MKRLFHFSFLIMALTSLTSCDTFWQGMAGGMGGYGMGGYQVMPGGFVRNTSMDYLLDPRYAMQQVNQQNRQEYLQQTNGGKTMTYEEWYSKIKAPAVLGTSGSSSSSSYSSSRSSSSSSSSSSRDCRRCMGTGKCQTCNGRGYYDEIGIGSGRHACPNCASNHNGKCASCNGSGKM